MNKDYDKVLESSFCTFDSEYNCIPNPQYDYYSSPYNKNKSTEKPVTPINQTANNPINDYYEKFENAISRLNEAAIGFEMVQKNISINIDSNVNQEDFSKSRTITTAKNNQSIINKSDLLTRFDVLRKDLADL